MPRRRRPLNTDADDTLVTVFHGKHIQAINPSATRHESPCIRLRTAQRAYVSLSPSYRQNGRLRHSSPNTSKRQVVPSPGSPSQVTPTEPQKPDTYEGAMTTSLMLRIPKRELHWGESSRSAPMVRKYSYEKQPETGGCP